MSEQTWPHTFHPDPDLPFGHLVESEPNYSLEADNIRATCAIKSDSANRI